MAIERATARVRAPASAGVSLQAVSDLLCFWFPAIASRSPDRHAEQIEWWYRGGADAAVVRDHVALHAAALNGELDGWAATPRGRLALVIVLDQFSRAIHRGTPLAYVGDERALQLSREALGRGDDVALASAWERLFLLLPMARSENLGDVDRALPVLRGLLAEAPLAYLWWFDLAIHQAQRRRELIARFGRDPLRNGVLQRWSTPEEKAYLRNEDSWTDATAEG